MGDPANAPVLADRTRSGGIWAFAGLAAVLIVAALLFAFGRGDTTAPSAGGTPVITGQASPPAPAQENTGTR
jgi:hypothetical protein